MKRKVGKRKKQLQQKYFFPVHLEMCIRDSTYSGTDHTREYVPFLAYSKTMKEGGALENEDTFSIIGASVADNFEVKMPEGTIGHSILEKLC